MFFSDLMPNVVLEKASFPFQPTIPPPAFESPATNFDGITGYVSDGDYCPSEMSLDLEELSSNNGHGEDKNLPKAGTVLQVY